MSIASTIAVTGLNASTARIANAASNIVNATSTNYLPTDVVSISTSVGNNNLGVSTLTIPRAAGSTVDLPTEIINLKEASNNYAADALALKIDQKTEKALLPDITT